MPLIKVMVKKDLKLIYKECMIILFLGIGAIVLAILREPFTPRYSPEHMKYLSIMSVLESFSFVFFYLFFPVLFVYSLFIEHLNKTDHQMFSLPVPRYRILLAKCILLFIIGMAVYAAYSLIYYLGLSTFDPAVFSENITRTISDLLLILGILSLVIGITSPIKKNRFLLGFLLFCGLGLLFSQSSRPDEVNVWNRYLHRFIQTSFSYDYPEMYQTHFSITGYGYHVICGVVFMLTGFVLYQKYEEV